MPTSYELDQHEAIIGSRVYRGIHAKRVEAISNSYFLKKSIRSSTVVWILIFVPIYFENMALLH